RDVDRQRHPARLRQDPLPGPADARGHDLHGLPRSGIDAAGPAHRAAGRAARRLAVRARILAGAAPVGRHHLDDSAPGPLRARTRAIADPVGWAAEGPAASAIGAGLTEGAVHGDVLRA